LASKNSHRYRDKLDSQNAVSSFWREFQFSLAAKFFIQNHKEKEEPSNPSKISSQGGKKKAISSKFKPKIESSNFHQTSDSRRKFLENGEGRRTCGGKEGLSKCQGGGK